MNIQREQLQILLNPGNLTRHVNLSKKEKTYVRDCFQKYGLSRDRFYYRCGRLGDGSGFAEWEVMGVYALIDMFCRERGIAPVPDCEKPRFYAVYCAGHREALWQFMDEHGMGRSSTIKRFRKWNFSEWELRGVAWCVEQICASEF